MLHCIEINKLENAKNSARLRCHVARTRFSFLDASDEVGKAMMEGQPIVLDNGSGTVKAAAIWHWSVFLLGMFSLKICFIL